MPEFRERLLTLIPTDLDVDRLVGRYVPNLVARPFALTRDFARAILDVVPSEPVRQILDDWEQWAARPVELGRQLLVELLAWQFASPVRWIETQDVLLGAPEQGGLGVEHLVEVGLAASPTLANLASRTLALPQHAGRHVVVHNARRDEARVLATDTDPAAGIEEESLAEPAVEAGAESTARRRGRGRGHPGLRADSRRGGPRGPGRSHPGRLRSGRGPVLRCHRRADGAASARRPHPPRADRRHRHHRDADQRRVLAPQPAAHGPGHRAAAGQH
ncbi:hypothetical protein [Actinomyces ruminis]|uniref:hypothetical protein n=1 Tax=Actinomyces ruminis TaxID=1937003 RepID=UPI00211ECCC5|nr:hypothetical protein [Actinomyces ruminis]